MTQGTKEPIGIAVVDKPAGLTSHDVVAKARKIFGTRKVGHSGTLDPDATGVLVLGVGRATRLLQFLTGLPKSYKGEIVFGEETSTLDSSGEVTHIHDMSGLTLSDVRKATKCFLGEIEQIPPMVSAVRIKGKRLYELREKEMKSSDPLVVSELIDSKFIQPKIPRSMRFSWIVHRAHT